MKIPGRKKTPPAPGAENTAESPKTERSVAIAVRVKNTGNVEDDSSSKRVGLAKTEGVEWRSSTEGSRTDKVRWPRSGERNSNPNGFRKPRIGIDCRMYGARFTGIWAYVERLVEYLAAHDAETDYVLFLSNEGMSACPVNAPNFKKVRVDARHYSWKEQLAFPMALYREKLDLMHFTHFNAPLGYFGKTAVTIHDLTLSFYPGRKMTGSFHRFAYQTVIRTIANRAARVFAVSEHTRKDIVEILDVDETKIRIIPNGIDAARFSTGAPKSEIDRVRAKLALKNPYLLYTGVFREHKNLVRLVEAFAKIAENFPNTDLVIAGKEDPGYLDVRDAIVRLGLTGRVRLPGFVDEEDLAPLYQGATAYVFPSLYEGFWLPVLEAMAAGVPVVCSKSSSLPEVAGAGNALFFDPLRSDNLADKLSALLSDESLRADLITRGKSRVKDFSWENMGKAVLEEYRGMLGK